MFGYQCFVLHNSVHIFSTSALLCRIPRRWWLKVSAGSYDTFLLPSSPMKQAEGSREMEGEVLFRRDTKSNRLKAASGTEWMYQRGALERGRQVSVHAVVFVCLYHMARNFGWEILWQIAENMSFGGIHFGD